MNLSAELRNNICGLVLTDSVQDIWIGSSSHIIDQPGLLAVCRQLREETQLVFYHLVHIAAERITISIHNFDFAPLMTYLDRLSAQERKEFGIRSELSIRLTLGRDIHSYTTSVVKDLARWLQYCSTKAVGWVDKGAKIQPYRVLGGVPRSLTHPGTEIQIATRLLVASKKLRTEAPALVESETAKVLQAWTERIGDVRREEMEADYQLRRQQSERNILERVRKLQAQTDRASRH